MARPRSAKVAHVLRARNAGGHTCHWPGCKAEVPPAKWGCRKHWNLLPQALKSRIWNSYRIGQETTKTPSADYIAAARAVQDWISDHLARQSSGGPLFDE